jgi:hypothetical protein
MTRKPAAPRREKKRPYRTPRLTVHGDLRTITLAKGGGSADGTGKPRTRASGTNA